MGFWRSFAHGVRDPRWGFAPFVDRMETAVAILERGRFCSNTRRLERRYRDLLAGFAVTGLSLGRIFIARGFLDGLIHRGAFSKCCPLWFCSCGSAWWRVRSWRRRFGGLCLTFFCWWLRAKTERTPKSQPGRNDYLMARWFVTGEEALAHEMFHWASGPLPPAPAPDVSAAVAALAMPQEQRHQRIATARWMVASVRCRHRDFDQLMTRMEEAHGVALTGV